MAGLRKCELAHCRVKIAGHSGCAEALSMALSYESPSKVDESCLVVVRVLVIYLVWQERLVLRTHWQLEFTKILEDRA